MPPKDPPPEKKPAARARRSDRAITPAVTQRVDLAWARLPTAVVEGEMHTAWKDAGDRRTTDGVAELAAAFERATLAPPVPEDEYVAQMMHAARDSHPAAVAPAAGTTPTIPCDDDLATTQRPAPLSGLPTLELDELAGLPFAPAAAPATTAAAPRQEPTSFALPKADGAALDLVGSRANTAPPDPAPPATVREVRDRIDVGDFSGALQAAETVLQHAPADGDALALAEICRTKLTQMYIARLGGLRRTPHVTTTPDQLRWLALDHRAGFLLSLVDGRSTLDEVLDMSGMAELDALRLLMQLLQQNVLKVD